MQKSRCLRIDRINTAQEDNKTSGEHKHSESYSNALKQRQVAGSITG